TLPGTRPAHMFIRGDCASRPRLTAKIPVIVLGGEPSLVGRVFRAGRHVIINQGSMMADLLAALGWIVLGLVAGSFLTVMIAVRVFQFPILWFVRLFLKEEEDADKAGQHALVQMLKE